MPESIYVRGGGGSVIEMDLPLPGAIASRLTKGHLTRVNADGTSYTAEPEPGVPSLPAERPAVTDHKSVWVGWAVTKGAKPDDAEAMTKRDLIEHYG